MVPLIAVWWVDASKKITDTWYDKDQVKQFIESDDNMILSLGILIGKDKETITLTSCYDGESCSFLTKIPISAIKTIYALKKDTKRKIENLKVLDIDSYNSIGLEHIK